MLDIEESGLTPEQMELIQNSEWSALIRSLMEASGIEDRYRKIMFPAIRAMARRMANVEINRRQKELIKERSDMLEAYSGFIKVAKGLVASLDLGIYDEVISVAVKRVDGRVEIVQVRE